MVLTRKEYEAVTLTLPGGATVRVVVLEVDGGRARLGFAAPPDVLISRDELLPRQDDHREGRPRGGP